MSDRRVLYLISIIAVIVFAACVLSRNYYLWNHFCQTNYDLGIFIDMIKKNAQGVLNPYIEVRQISQFNDHWTPLLSLLSPLSLIVPLPHFAFLLEVGFLILVFGLLIWAERTRVISTSLFTFLTCFFFFNRDLFEAAYFPIHPATWSAFGLIFWSLLIYKIDWQKNSLSRRDQFLLLFNYFLLTLMDEQNSFAGVSFALGLLVVSFVSSVKKLRAFSLVFFVFSISMVWMANEGRRLMFGPLFPYFKDRKILDPTSFLSRYSDFSLESVKTIVLHFLIVIPFLFLMKGQWREISKVRVKLFLLFSIFAPLILGRILTNGFGRHYDIALISLWTGFFMIAIPQKVFNRRNVIWCCVFFFALSISKVKKAFTAPTTLAGLNCVRRDVSVSTFQERTAKLHNAFELIKEKSQSENFKILAQSNLGPNLLTSFPKAQVYHLGEYEIQDTQTVDWIIFERGQFGEHLSLGPDALEEIIGTMMALPNLKFIHQDDSLFMAQGEIPLEILKKYFRTQPQHE